MRFRMIGQDEATQTEVVRELVCDTREDVEAFAVLMGIVVEQIEALPDWTQPDELADVSSRSPQSTSSPGPTPAGVAHKRNERLLFDPLRQMRQVILYLIFPLTIAVLGVSVLKFAGMVDRKELIATFALDVSYWPALLSLIVRARPIT